MRKLLCTLLALMMLMPMLGLGETATTDSPEESDGNFIRLGLGDNYEFADHFDPALRENLTLIAHNFHDVQFYLPEEAMYYMNKSYTVAYRIEGTATFQLTAVKAEPPEDVTQREEWLCEKGREAIDSIATSSGEHPYKGDDYQTWQSCTINGLDCVWVQFSSFPMNVAMVFEYNGYAYYAMYFGGLIMSVQYNNLIDIFYTSIAPFESRLAPDEDGVIRLSEDYSREYFGIEADSYIPIPDTNAQFLMSSEFYMSGANGQENHVMTVSHGEQFHDQVYAGPLSSPGSGATPIEINGMTGTYKKYDQGNMMIGELEIEANGKTFSMTATTQEGEDCLAALFGLFSPVADASTTVNQNDDPAATSGTVTPSYPSGTLGPVLIDYENDDSASTPDEVFYVSSIGEKTTLALMEGGECLIEGYFREMPGVIDWEIRNKQEEVIATGQENQLSKHFEFSLPSCFEAGNTYQMTISSGGETHTFSLDVIEASADTYPRNDKLEIISPAEGVPFVAEYDERDGQYWYRFEWKESGYGLVHIHIQGEGRSYDGVDNPSINDRNRADATGVHYFSDSFLEAGKEYIFTIEQGDESVSRTFIAGAMGDSEGQETSSDAGSAGTSAVANDENTASPVQNSITGAGEIFKDVTFAKYQLTEGFTIGLPVGESELGTWEITQADAAEMPASQLVSDGISICQITTDVSQAGYFYEKQEDAIHGYESITPSVINWNPTYIYSEEHPVLLATYEDGARNHYGAIVYIRNNQILKIQLQMGNRDISLEDLNDLASQISYDESLSTIRQAQVEFTVTPEKDITHVSAGKTAKFIATFGDTELVNAKAKNNKVFWFVGDMDGYASKDATIDTKGVLKVNKNLEDVTQVRVWALSESFLTSGEMEFTLLPQVTAVNIEPTVISLFAVEGAAETVKVSLEPASVPLEGLTWTVSAKNVIEIEDHEDGTAVICPLKAGKVTVTVKEEGGKAAKFTVTVKQPVEALELSAKGKAVPGKAVTMSAKVTPANASDKAVNWALDVDESIATISAKGQVKISKDAPVGTVITVTCTAEGAPQLVVETMELEVVEK